MLIESKYKEKRALVEKSFDIVTMLEEMHPDAMDAVTETMYKIIAINTAIEMFSKMHAECTIDNIVCLKKAKAYCM